MELLTHLARIHAVLAVPELAPRVPHGVRLAACCGGALGRCRFRFDPAGCSARRRAMVPLAPRMTGSGHEDAFPPPTLNARCRFSQGTFAGTRSNSRRAERAGRGRSTPRSRRLGERRPEPRARVHPVRPKLSSRQGDNRLLHLRFAIIIVPGDLRPCRGKN